MKPEQRKPYTVILPAGLRPIVEELAARRGLKAPDYIATLIDEAARREASQNETGEQRRP